MQLKIVKFLAIIGAIVLIFYAQKPVSLAAAPNTAGEPSKDNATSNQLVSLEKINKDIEKALVAYSFPLSKFNFSLKTEGDKVDYSGGETFKLNGVLSYNSNLKEEVDKFIEQCQGWTKCASDQKCKSEAASACNLPSFSLPFIEDAGIIAQVWRKDIEEGPSKGDHLIDEFYVAKNLSLKEGKDHAFSVGWGIPKELQSGSYYLSLSAIGSDRFNFMGFPFSPSSKAISYSFNIDNENPGITIDKNNIKLNGESYNYLNPVPFITGDKADVNLAIENLNQKEEKIKIKYTISKWSQEDPSDILSAKEEFLSIPRNSKKNYDISIPVASLCSTCNIGITASTENSMSRANVRFVTGNEGNGLFRFLGIVRTNKGTLSPIFCPRSAHIDKETAESTIKIYLLDKKDKLIGSWTGNGKIGTNTTCYIISSITLGEFPYIKMKGEILNSKNQILNDQKEIVYDFSQKYQESSGLDVKTILIVVFIALLFIIIVGIAIIKIGKKDKNINGDTPKIQK